MPCPQDICAVIKNKLTSEQMEMFNKTILGPLLNVDMVINDRLFHHSLSREVSDERSDIISFEILGKKVTFTQEDFNLVTSLWLTGVMVQKDECKERLQELILRRRHSIEKKKTYFEVEEAFK